MKLTDLQRILNSFKVRILNMFARGFVESIDDSSQIQKVKAKLMADESLDDLERLQDYGFASKPLPNAEVLVVFPGGNRGHGVVIKADDRRYRIKNLQNGEVAIYTDEGDKIHFKRNRKIEITTLELTVNAQTKVDVNTETANVIASTVANVQAPTTNITSPTGVNVITPIMAVSGLISCSGIAAGGAAPVAGKAVIQGSIEASGNVEDAGGTMQDIRDGYNAHTHTETGTTTSTPTPTV